MSYRIAMGAFAAALLGTSGPALADCTAQDASAVTSAFAARMPNTRVTKLSCTPWPGVFEVVAGKNVFYTDASARLVFVGSMYDLVAREDLTEPVRDAAGGGEGAKVGRVDVPDDGPAVTTVARPPTPELSAAWETFPANTAVVSGAGRPLKLAVFSDLGCSYCRELHKALVEWGDVEVHEYVTTILGTESLADKALCSDDPAAAVDRTYRGERLAGGTPGCSRERTAQVRSFMDSKGWRGTPMLVRADGAVMVGFPGRDKVRGWLTDGSK